MDQRRELARLRRARRRAKRRARDLGLVGKAARASTSRLGIGDWMPKTQRRQGEDQQRQGKRPPMRG